MLSHTPMVLPPGVERYPPRERSTAELTAQRTELIRLSGVPLSFQARDIAALLVTMPLVEGAVHTFASGPQAGTAFVRIPYGGSQEAARLLQGALQNPQLLITTSTEDDFRVALENQRSQPPMPFVIRLRGLPFAAGEPEVREFLNNDADIIRIDLGVHENGQTSGDAFVELRTEDAARRAAALDRQSMGRRYIEVMSSTWQDRGTILRGARSRNRTARTTPPMSFSSSSTMSLPPPQPLPAQLGQQQQQQQAGMVMLTLAAPDMQPRFAPAGAFSMQGLTAVPQPMFTQFVTAGPNAVGGPGASSAMGTPMQGMVFSGAPGTAGPGGLMGQPSSLVQFQPNLYVAVPSQGGAQGAQGGTYTLANASSFGFLAQSQQQQQQQQSQQTVVYAPPVEGPAAFAVRMSNVPAVYASETNVRLLLDMLEVHDAHIHLQYDARTGNFTGVVYVELHTESQRDRALARNGVLTDAHTAVDIQLSTLEQFAEASRNYVLTGRPPFHSHQLQPLTPQQQQQQGRSPSQGQQSMTFSTPGQSSAQF